MAAALGGVLALAWLAGVAARRITPRLRLGAPDGFALLGTLALDPRRRLHLVALPGGRALVLTGGAADVLLPWPGEPGPSPPDTTR